MVLASGFRWMKKINLLVSPRLWHHMGLAVECLLTADRCVRPFCLCLPWTVRQGLSRLPSEQYVNSPIGKTNVVVLQLHLMIPAG